MKISNTSPSAPDHWASEADQAIEGEQHARAYLDRLNAGMAQPDELAALMTYLRGELVQGACRAVEKALRGRRYG